MIRLTIFTSAWLEKENSNICLISNIKDHTKYIHISVDLEEFYNHLHTTSLNQFLIDWRVRKNGTPT